MRRSARWWGLGLAVFSFVACGPETEVDDEPVAKVRSAALRNPDANEENEERGRDLLVNNGTEAVPYLSCGLPRGVVTIASWLGVDLIGTGPTLPGRTRGMRDLPYDVSFAKRPSGVEVVTTNCLLCHASKLGGSVVIGLGNPNVDFTQDQSVFGLAPLALDVVSLFLTPAENVELRRYRRVTDAEATVPRPTTIGLNPADVMFGVLASHRDATTLRWLDQPKPEAKINNVLFTDVPAWWNTWRHENLFFSGFGRKDHARIMMTASLMCLEDTAEAAKIDAYFGDIEAFIKSLRPPKYTDVTGRAIDAARAGRGRTTYVNTCSGCHGDSENDIPPVSSVLASIVGTDPAYAVAASLQGDSWFRYFFQFFNESWYGTAEAAAGRAGKLVQEPDPVYQPPPLGGVWATAPYFHNGSVPTLEGVLNPTLRPALFRRSFTPEEYDFGTNVVGWPYVVVGSKGSDTRVYDTRVPGYNNTGHTFAARLTDAERRDLLEYLKTL